MDYIQTLKKLGFSLNPSSWNENSQVTSYALIYLGKFIGIYSELNHKIDIDHNLSEKSNEDLEAFLEAYEKMKNSELKIPSLKENSKKALEEQVKRRTKLLKTLKKLEKL